MESSSEEENENLEPLERVQKRRLGLKAVPKNRCHLVNKDEEDKNFHPSPKSFIYK